MKASQRKRRIAARPPILDITRLALSPGDVLVVRVKDGTTAQEREQMSRFLARAAGVSSMITDDVIDMAVLQAPAKSEPIVLSGATLTPEQIRRLEEMLPAPSGPVAHHHV